MCNVYRRFVSAFGRAAAPLNVRSGKIQPYKFELNVVELDAFQELREQLMFTQLSALPPTWTVVLSGHRRVWLPDRAWFAAASNEWR